MNAPPATVALLGRQWPTFQLWGAAGFVAAATIAAALTYVSGLSPGVMVAFAIASFALLFLITYATKVALGREVIVNYHHLLAVSGIAGLVAWAAGVPVIVHLSAFVVALMVFQGFGRIGCLSAGCCHGRPARWGVRYGERHIGCGFPLHFSGVLMFPTQAIEAGWAFTVGAAGAVLLIRGAAPSDVLLGVTAAYAAGRLGTEFLRGDADRRRLGALSEAQWTSLLLLSVVAGAAWLTHTGPRISLAALTFVAVAATVAWMIIWCRTPQPERRLLDADHILELAGAVAIACGDANSVVAACRTENVRLATTSRGVSVSAGSAHSWEGAMCYYTISCNFENLTERSALRLARLILLLRHPGGSGTLIGGRGTGTFHLLVATTLQTSPR